MGLESGSGVDLYGILFQGDSRDRVLYYNQLVVSLCLSRAGRWKDSESTRDVVLQMHLQGDQLLKCLGSFDT